jgi:hypothetical protein
MKSVMSRWKSRKRVYERALSFLRERGRSKQVLYREKERVI